MSFHPWGLVVFAFLTIALVLLFAAGLCQRDLGREDSELKRTSLWELMATLVLIAMLALVGGIVEESAKAKTR